MIDQKYDFSGILARAQRLLLPGGIITFTSEHPSLIAHFSELGRRPGFRHGIPKVMPVHQATEKSEYTRQFTYKKIRQVVLVLPPKKALPFPTPNVSK